MAARRGNINSTTSSQQLEESPPRSGRPRCSGRAAEALEKFQKRQLELEWQGRRKPDMIAYGELRGQWTPRPKRHGEIPGVPVGLRLGGRGEAAILGIHGQILSGIDAAKGQPCYAVCLSGGYDDDDDAAPDGTVRYTGSGGRKGGRQVKDQTENADNSALKASLRMGEPIRLLRGGTDRRGKPEYFYEGLYKCTECNYEASVDGPMVYRFTLVPVPGHCKPRSMVVGRHKASPRKVKKKSTQRPDRDMKRQRREATRPPDEVCI